MFDPDAVPMSELQALLDEESDDVLAWNYLICLWPHCGEGIFATDMETWLKIKPNEAARYRDAAKKFVGYLRSINYV